MTQTIEPGGAVTVELMVLGDERSPLDLLLRWRTQLGMLLFETRSTLPPAPPGEPRRASCHFPRFPLYRDGAVLGVALIDPASGIFIDTQRLELHIPANDGPLMRFDHAWTAPGDWSGEPRPTAPARRAVEGGLGTALATGGEMD